jgi:hypothetical protein
MAVAAASRGLVVGILALSASLVLVGCTGTPAPSPSDSLGASPGASDAPEPDATPTPDPTLNGDGSALQNLEYFTWVLQAAVDDGVKTGPNFINALAAAGFKKKNMELTPAKTAIGLDADNIQFSVKINDTCLLGQYGNVGLATAAMPVLETGRCIVGSDRAV